MVNAGMTLDARVVLDARVMLDAGVMLGGLYIAVVQKYRQQSKPSNFMAMTLFIMILCT